MTSKPIYVWTWLPGRTDPIPCGRVDFTERGGLFTYGARYLKNPDAIPLYGIDLKPGPQSPTYSDLHGCLRDGLPDAWGQQVIAARLTGRRGRNLDTADVDYATYMLQSGSQRFGACDFQASPHTYVPRDNDTVTLDELAAAAAALEDGLPIGEHVSQALEHGTSVGGARPKVTISDGDDQWIVKLSSSSDRTRRMRTEVVGVELARASGVDVPEVELRENIAGRDALFVRRFDRGPEGTRKHTVSALTIMGRNEMTAHNGSYLEFLRELEQRGAPKSTAETLFRRVAVNIAVGNTDDHARNHAAFWDGTSLTLAPAFDVDPCRGTSYEQNQALAYGPGGYGAGDRSADFHRLCDFAGHYGLRRADAEAIVDDVIDSVHRCWDDACEKAHMTQAERQRLWNTVVLAPQTTQHIARSVAVSMPTRRELPQGRYLVDDDGTPRRFIVSSTRAGDTTIAEEGSDGTRTSVKDEHTRVWLARTVTDPAEAMAQYGKHTGRCGRCGRVLTDETSHSVGLGPSCRTKV